MIRHTVVFTLKHLPDSPEAQQFLKDAQVLATLPTVRQFQQLRQVSQKNTFQYGFSMEFEDQAGYDAYDANPIHRDFVQNRWQTEVADFMEVDYVPL